MPAAIDYNPSDSDLRNAATTERLGRTSALDKATQYYDGQHKKPLIIGPNEPDLNIIINLLQMRVDRRCDFLFREFPEIILSDDVVDDESPLDKWLESAWKANGGVTFAKELALSGCLSGHPVVRVIPPEKPGDFPQLRLVDNCIAFWSADDYKKILWYELEWKVGKSYFRQDILNCQALDLPGQWMILEYQSDNEKQWFQTGSIPWNYPLSPVVAFQHWPKWGQYYGRAETDDLQLNDAVNRIFSQANSIIRNHAFPKTIATGVTSAKVQATAVNSFWAIENENAKVFNLEMQSDLSTITTMISSLIDAYNTQGRTILLKGGPADFARVTNLGIRTAFMDMLNANATLQQQYGEGIKAISKLMLMLAGKNWDIPIDLQWADPLPNNILETAQEVQVERAMGLISKQTSADTMGLDWDQEQARMAAEDEADGSAMDRMISTGGSQPFALPTMPGTDVQDHADAPDKL